ncbi:hypothetical protein NCS57_00980500 [Fusarium keratoplasticum]|uniref:Uncharacterized protein n=1 Tax=Fusarium keratoplasticum TaxID=1328300 RepID=A0ACC0QTD0_9HYPO|nr:hypothetical protein NCS57_00980500 [Fusarium keratoplasticum]KAI8663782.1 hypothetical protein NCS57_00980500 [Fusarium keratoplasticum]KAI8664425.1 hypothetical protein NCS55_00951200 [Fusarium keratoplasticum]
MPDADASPLRREPNTNNQASEYPTTERPMTEKTKSTAEKESKIQDAEEEKAGDSSGASTEDEEHIEFDEWVKSFAADPDSAWKQMQLKFEALMATDSDGYMTQDIQEDEEDAEVADETPTASRATECESPDRPRDIPDHEENCECCECESPGLPEDYPKNHLEQAKKLGQGES